MPTKEDRLRDEIRRLRTLLAAMCRVAGTTATLMELVEEDGRTQVYVCSPNFDEKTIAEYMAGMLHDHVQVDGPVEGNVEDKS